MDAARRKLLRSLEEGLVFFTGAGVSRSAPSSLPLSREIIRTAHDVLAAAAAPALNRDQEEYVSRTLRLFSALPLELLMGILAHLDSQAPSKLLAGLRDVRTNRNHMAIGTAQLCFPGRLLFTLNFDHLHEDAICEMTGITACALVDAGDYRSFRRTGSAEDPTVCHLHGILTQSGVSESLIATVEAVGTGMAPERAGFLRDRLATQDILCVGYSDNDVDTFPIIRTQARQLYWYSHNGSVPPQLLNSDLSERCTIIRRNADENDFADVLCNMSRTIHDKLQEFTTPRDNDARTVETRLAQIRNSLDGILGPTAPIRGRSALFVLAALSDEIGERDTALMLLNRAQGVGDGIPSTLAAAESLLHGYVLERSGQVGAAKRVYDAATVLSPAPVARKLLALRRAGAALGLWKQNPLRVWDLVLWWRILRSGIGDQSTELVLRTQWQWGDYYHFLAEVLLVPSSWMSFRLRGNERKVALCLDFLAIRLIGALRRRYLFSAGKAYIRFLRISYRSHEAPLPGYTMLVALRYKEVCAALGRLNKAHTPWTPVVDPEEYYRWVGTSHGIGNALCTKGIVAMYMGKLDEARAFFDDAQTHYGSHLAGHRKLRICRARCEIWGGSSLMPHPKC